MKRPFIMWFLVFLAIVVPIAGLEILVVHALAPKDIEYAQWVLFWICVFLLYVWMFQPSTSPNGQKSR